MRRVEDRILEKLAFTRQQEKIPTVLDLKGTVEKVGEG